MLTNRVTLLLPPANEVWGKIMFLLLSVILFTRVGGWLPSMHHRSHDQGVCIQAGGSASREALLGTGLLPEGVCILGAGVEQTPPWDTTQYGPQVDGMPPT